MGSDTASYFRNSVPFISLSCQPSVLFSQQHRNLHVCQNFTFLGNVFDLKVEPFQIFISFPYIMHGT